MEKIKVAIVKYGEMPYLTEIPNTLEALKDIVKGYIEMIRLPFNHNLVLICNEEGKLLNLPPTMDLGYDVICGDFLIAKDIGLGEIGSLTPANIEELNNYLNIKLD
jgi:hypothetical protein